MGYGCMARWADVIADVAFDLELEHGRCVGVLLPSVEAEVDAAAEALAPEERNFASGLAPRRRRTWVGGRVAMHEALARAGLATGPVLCDARGAPILPPGVTGSITHKETLAAALVAREPLARIGVDLELDLPRTTDISARVLAQDEAEELAGLDPRAREHEVLLRFSSKEAIYKALDPFVRRYVAFHEVSVSTRSDGSASVIARLRQGEGPFAIEVRWRRFDGPMTRGVVLATARVTSLG
jgi:enterobactin synthetase component D